jgi:hypothetical protein
MTRSDPQQIPPSHIDIGGVALPRRELAGVLPDIDRFEKYLTDALAVDTHMKNGDGSIPSYVRKWPEARVAGVIATLKEIGSLREQLGQQGINPDHNPTGDGPSPGHSG